jgi:DNA-binding transcriptional LysR family regulator
MAMDRLRRVANIWNWLPAFRVVAEYQSIQKAAVVLNVSASALSRTVRLLEDAIGATLFVRSATGLTLTTFGTELLKGTRDAMRRIDDVIANEETAGTEERTFAAAASGAVLASVLDRALCAVVRDFEGVRYRTTSVDEESAVAELLRGNLDLTLVEGRAGFELPDDLTSERIGDLDFAVLAPPAHPMASRNDDALAADVTTTKTVVLGSAMSHERTAHAVATVESIESAQKLAEQGPFLAVLPLVLAPPTFRVVARSSARVGVTAVFRKPLEGEAPAPLRALVHAIRAVVTSRNDSTGGVEIGSSTPAGSRVKEK